MRRSRIIAAVVAATLLPLGLSVPASAATTVHIEAETIFDEQAPFTSNLEDCESGTVEEGRFTLAGSRNFGIFNGFKVFTCEEGEGGFTIRLQATFDDAGSTGTWAVTHSWGDQAGLHGSGTLVGEPFEGGILDIYDGVLRP